MSGTGIRWAICKSAPCSRQITTPASHHSVFAGQMPFLPPNQQRQSTEGNSTEGNGAVYYICNSFTVITDQSQHHCCIDNSTVTIVLLLTWNCYATKLQLSQKCYKNSRLWCLVFGMPPFNLILRTASRKCFGCSGPVSSHSFITSNAATQSSIMLT